MTTGPDTDGREQLTRIGVLLISQAVEDLERTAARGGMSDTDIINRAISLYEFIDEQLAAGKQLLLRDPGNGETQRVELL